MIISNALGGMKAVATTCAIVALLVFSIPVVGQTLSEPSSTEVASLGLPYDASAESISLVYGASSIEAVTAFYTDVLELERISDIHTSAGNMLLRYMAGDSELGFLISAAQRPKFPGGVDAAYGVRMVAFLLPQEKKDRILKKLRASGRVVPEFNSGRSSKGYNFEYGMAYDNDGNQIELVFLDDNAPPQRFRQIQIALSVSNLKKTQHFMRDVLGLIPRVDQGSMHRYELGPSQIKYIQKKPGLPTWVGTPDEKIGMMMIQFAVTDLNVVEEKMRAYNVEIVREPFAIGPSTNMMFVTGPDDVIYEFIERKRNRGNSIDW